MSPLLSPFISLVLHVEQGLSHLSLLGLTQNCVVYTSGLSSRPMCVLIEILLPTEGQVRNKEGVPSEDDQNQRPKISPVTKSTIYFVSLTPQQ